MRSDATLSDCGAYRYSLTREWHPDWFRICWIMLNPSTADAHLDDPTIRRCIAFSKHWGAGSLIVVNLYAYRATKPADLWKAADPVGPKNNEAIANATRDSHDLVVAALGANARPDRVRDVLGLFKRRKHRLHCLGTTKHGAPRHPLYLKKDARPVRWS